MLYIMYGTLIAAICANTAYTQRIKAVHLHSIAKINTEHLFDAFGISSLTDKNAFGNQ